MGTLTVFRHRWDNQKALQAYHQQLQPVSGIITNSIPTHVHRRYRDLVMTAGGEVTDGSVYGGIEGVGMQQGKS